MNTVAVDDTQLPSVVFLGFCELAEYRCDISYRLNVYDLKNLVHSPVYPMTFQRGCKSKFLISLSNVSILENWKIIIKSSNGKELWNYSFNNNSKTEKDSPNAKLACIPPKDDDFSIITLPDTWITILLPTDDLSVPSPGSYSFFISQAEQEFKIGTIYFGWGPVLSFTDDQIAAIRSNSNTPKHVFLDISCNSCGDKITIYSGLERKLEIEKNGTVWYQDLHDKFVCGCGKLESDLTYIRKNMHALLLNSLNNRGEVSFTRMYERDSLELTIDNFVKLLESNPLEGPVQKFIENNSILLNQFSPQRIYYKKNILNDYQTDIVILNHKNELILIELEQPRTKILTKKGEITADLHHAIGQAKDWLHVINDYKSAVLHDFGLELSAVTNIKGVVIVGRDKGYDPKHLRKLKCYDFADVEFFTYDDLVNSLVSLVRGMKSL